jgi:hypothetical protein
MAKSSGWVNKDGLIVGFGPRTVSKDSASRQLEESLHEIVLKVSDLTKLGTDATLGTAGTIYDPVAIQNSAFIPANATVQEVWITTDTAATSTGAADFVVGAYTISPTTGKFVAVDADGFAAAADSALADFSVAGETIVLAKGSNAALVGKATVGTSPVTIACVSATEVYTAGALTVRVKYTTPAN